MLFYRRTQFYYLSWRSFIFLVADAPTRQHRQSSVYLRGKIITSIYLMAVPFD